MEQNYTPSFVLADDPAEALKHIKAASALDQTNKVIQNNMAVLQLYNGHLLDVR